MKSNFTLSTDYAELARLEDEFAVFLPGDQNEVRGQVVLAVHELCVNIINHGYQGEMGEIRFKVNLDNDVLSIEMEDDATGVYTPPDILTPPDPLDLPESGWGMYIIAQVMDRFDYRRVSEGNHWQMQKQL